MRLCPSCVSDGFPSCCRVVAVSLTSSFFSNLLVGSARRPTGWNIITNNADRNAESQKVKTKNPKK